MHTIANGVLARQRAAKAHEEALLAVVETMNQAYMESK